MRKKSEPNKDRNLPLPENATDVVLQMLGEVPVHNPKVMYLMEQVLSKFVSEDTDPPEVRRQRAINKWLAVERENEATNDRLLTVEEEFNLLPRVAWRSFCDRVRWYVAKVLPETIPLDVLFGGFSGGATTSKSRLESHPALKYLGEADVTSAASWWFDLLSVESPLWLSFQDQLEIRVVRGNELFTVPKSTDIDRCAAKEPDLNMYLQKGVGNYIRRRLKRFGIDLNDQSINQRLAREGSITGRLATIDLSSASDSISTSVVAEFLPLLWFGFLSDLRSPETNIDGEWHQNHMFSSMGNGFTFELESLLFWAVSSSVRDLSGCRGVVSVYGDDLIVESEIFSNLSWVLEFLGFSVNLSKSFATGFFRESCGGHYYDGYDISPFYVRKPLRRVRDAINLANQIRKWSVIPDMGFLDPTLESLWAYLRSLIPNVLWGGHDLNCDTQLVSYDPPRKRLVEVTKDHQNPVGGYLLWLDSCRDAQLRDDAIITSSRTTSQGVFRLRNAPASGPTLRDRAAYLFEIYQDRPTRPEEVLTQI